MKILHVVRGLANASGPTHIVAALAEHQARLGHEVEVFAVEKHGCEPVVPDPALVTSHVFPTSIRTQGIGVSLALQRALRHRVGDFDVVHIHMIWNFPTWCAMREAFRAGVPYVVAPQGSLDDWALARHRLRKQLYGVLFENRYYQRAACFQALSEAEVDQCRRFGIRTRIARLANGVELDDRQDGQVREALWARHDVPATDRILLFLGRIFPKKGLDLLAAAFGEICGERDDVTLIIAGHDSGSGYALEVKSMLEQAGADGKVRFVGEVRGADKTALLRAADFFVLSSYSEGLPMAVLEAMACGLPVLITPACNLPEVGEHAAGWIVPANEGAVTAGLREALARHCEWESMGESALRLVREQFLWENIAIQSIGFYQSLRANE